MRIGIYGGSFDPIHVGHVNVIEEVKFNLGLDVIIIIPAFLSPHKTSSVLNAESRFACVKLAMRDYSGITVSNWEIAQGSSVYTFDTLNHFKSLYPDDEIILIIGTDQYKNFENWHKHEEILVEFKVVVVHRYHETLEIKVPFQLVETPIFDVSSTLIRERMKRNEPFKHLVPHTVYQYLKENH